MAITDWPELERPREKLLKRGTGALSDAELLAVLLRTGLRGGTAVDLGRDLLLEAGSLRRLLDMPAERLRRLRGLGGSRSAMLLAALELGKRHLDETLTCGPLVEDPEAVVRLLTAELRSEPGEVFLVVFLDNKNRVLATEKMFHGTVDSAAVYPREVVRRALEHNAANIIIAHNHPSGIAEPSQADRDLTDNLRRSLKLIDVRIIDHLVIGDGQWTSFSRRGWM